MKRRHTLNNLFPLKSKKGSEFVESLLTFPMLIIIVFSIAYGVIYFNAKSQITSQITYIVRNMTTAQSYCAYTKSGGSLTYDSEKTADNSSYARNFVTNSNDSDGSSLFDGIKNKCYLSLESFESYLNESGKLEIRKVVYYDFFNFDYSSVQSGIGSEFIGPEKIANKWKIGNYINLTVTSSIFSSGSGITMFDLVTSINFFGGMHKVEVISSTATVSIRFQLENDVCDDILLTDEEKPDVCLED